MSAGDLERCKDRFAALLLSFYLKILLPRETPAALIARRKAILQDMETLLAEVEPLGEEGAALQGQILDFTETHRAEDEPLSDGLQGGEREPEEQKDSGRSLGKWIKDREGEWYLAPAVWRPEEESTQRRRWLLDHYLRSAKTQKK